MDDRSLGSMDGRTSNEMEEFMVVIWEEDRRVVIVVIVVILVVIVVIVVIVVVVGLKFSRCKMRIENEANQNDDHVS